MRLTMSQRFVCAILCAAMGLMIGALVAYLFIKPDKWIDAKLILTLFAGGGYVIGHMLAKKFDKK